MIRDRWNFTFGSICLWSVTFVQTVHKTPIILIHYCVFPSIFDQFVLLIILERHFGWLTYIKTSFRTLCFLHSVLPFLFLAISNIIKTPYVTMNIIQMSCLDCAHSLEFLLCKSVLLALPLVIFKLAHSPLVALVRSPGTIFWL